MLGILLMRVRCSGRCWWHRGLQGRRGLRELLGLRGRQERRVLRELLGLRVLRLRFREGGWWGWGIRWGMWWGMAGRAMWR
jgi:hypothetical protein